MGVFWNGVYRFLENTRELLKISLKKYLFFTVLTEIINLNFLHSAKSSI